jgi:hypothetical protein
MHAVTLFSGIFLNHYSTLIMKENVSFTHTVFSI